MLKRVMLVFGAVLAMGNIAHACIPPPPSNGVQIYTQETSNFGGFPVTTFSPGIGVGGDYIGDIPGQASSAGYVNFESATNQYGLVNVEDMRLPALWDFDETTGPCGVGTPVLELNRSTYPGTQVVITCFDPTYAYANMDPDQLSSTTGTNEIYITGSGFSNTYGPPKVQIVDSGGDAWGSPMSATYVNSSEVTVNNIPPLTAGTWFFVVYEIQTSGGSYEGIAAATATSQ